MKHSLLLLHYIFTLIYTISYYFTGNGLDESVLYHLSTGIQGAGVSHDILPILFIFLLVSIIFLSLLFIMKCIKYATILLFTLLFMHPLTYNIAHTFGFLNNSSGNIVFASENKDIPIGEEIKEILGESKKKNLVLIYLESFERGYYTTYAKKLRALEATDYTNVHQPMGTNWTIAGMVGSQCGIPLIGSVDKGNTDNFLTKADCMSDILSREGYSNHYIAGADIEFANKGNFYRSHNYSTVKGYKELGEENSLPHDWGMHDEKLLNILFTKFLQYSGKEDPFTLTTLTLDTHGNEGELSPSCNKIYGDIRDAYVCTDKLVSEFIERIQNSKYGENTVIVVMSDHLAMNHNPSVKYIPERRSELFLVVGEDGSNNRKMSMFDTGPTILKELGVYKNIGLGVSAESDRENLVEIYENYDDILRSHKATFRKFW